MALTKDGSVYVWGSNAFGQLGVPEIQKQSEYPVQVPTEVYLYRKTSKYASEHHSACVLRSRDSLT